MKRAIASRLTGSKRLYLITAAILAIGLPAGIVVAQQMTDTAATQSSFEEVDTAIPAVETAEEVVSGSDTAEASPDNAELPATDEQTSTGTAGAPPAGATTTQTADNPTVVADEPAIQEPAAPTISRTDLVSETEPPCEAGESPSDSNCGVITTYCVTTYSDGTSDRAFFGSGRRGSMSYLRGTNCPIRMAD